MTVASGGLGWYMSGRVLRPVRAITETARRASEQHLGERLGLTGARDELKELADTFDDMLERLDAAFATQRRFVANASHELRTPLTVMRTAIDVTLAKPSPTARQLTDMAVRVRRSIDRAESMIEALLTLAVSDQGKLSTEFTDLATWTEDAIDAAVYLEIANSGPFIPDDAVPSLFEPFRRMEARTGVRDGVGLGLSIARSVVTAHRATVAARSQPAGGLNISVVIPRDSVVIPRELVLLQRLPYPGASLAKNRPTRVPSERVTMTLVICLSPIRWARPPVSSLGRTVDTPGRITAFTTAPGPADRKPSR
jgi:signal transduction histidine kinase